jgi:hypothetical protein
MRAKSVSDILPCCTDSILAAMARHSSAFNTTSRVVGSTLVNKKSLSPDATAAQF